MTLQMQRETTEFVFVGVSGEPPSISFEVAFMAPGERPVDDDWIEGVIVGGPEHQLWNDAGETGLPGDYYVAVLVGSYGGNTLVLDPGDYQVWLRPTDVVERPVRIAPVALVIL